MRSRPSVFGLCKNEIELPAGAVALSNTLSGAGAGGMKRACSAYWRETLSVVGCGVV
jgi:hypothetical protein